MKKYFSVCSTMDTDTTREASAVQWSSSAYFPIVCCDCGKRLGHLAERARVAWAKQPHTGLSQTRDFNGVWPAIGVVSMCCKQTIMTFSAKDEMTSSYDREDGMEQPANFCFDEFITIESMKRGNRDVPTRYSTSTADYYKN